jgi:endoglucanase
MPTGPPGPEIAIMPSTRLARPAAPTAVPPSTEPPRPLRLVAGALLCGALLAAPPLPGASAGDALAAPVSEQIMVDQFGYRPHSAKLVIFARPQVGQNAGTPYAPPAMAAVRNLDSGLVAASVALAPWAAGKVSASAGDQVWYADISAVEQPGTYVIEDGTNHVRSYPFRIAADVYAPVLKAAVRMYFYQRCGGDVPEANGGAAWHHPACHLAEGQDRVAQLYIDGVAKGQPRDVHGGWHDAGDYNKYVPFTGVVIPALVLAYELNPAAFGDDWNIPESGNGIPDLLDEVKWECDWLCRMQLEDGSACNRVTERESRSGVTPDLDSHHVRYYTQPTSWATATLASDLACFARVIRRFPSQAAYAATLKAAAERAWAWLGAHPDMTPADGRDHGRPSEAADAQCDNGKDGDLERRVWAALQLGMLDPGTPAYLEFVRKGRKDVLQPCFVQYALSPGADPGLAGEIRAGMKRFADERVAQLKAQTDAYRAWLPGYWWGCNEFKAEYGFRALFAERLKAAPASDGDYHAAAEEYLHYLHGRNPLCQCYLTNMGAKGAKTTAGKSIMRPFHTWFGNKSAWDGPDSLGPPPGYLVGGPNPSTDGGGAPTWLVPPAGQPAEKSFKDWNTTWNDAHQENENCWAFTEPAIYYQANYVLLLAQFVGAAADAH